MAWRLPAGLARYVAPAAFLLAVTGLVLLVRSTLHSSKPATEDAPALITARTTTAPAAPSSATFKRYYLISSGDTLGAIAAQFSTTVDELLRLNPGVVPTALVPGDQLRIR